MGIGPTCAAWKAAVLPLNYARVAVWALNYARVAVWALNYARVAPRGVFAPHCHRAAFGREAHGRDAT